MHLSKVVAVLVSLLLITSLASADPIPTAQLELSSGATTVTVLDNGAITLVGPGLLLSTVDLNPAVGAVTFIGAVGDFNVNVTTGLSKPIVGNADHPKLDLNSVNVSDAAGEITIRFTDTNFTGPLGALTTLVGGTTSGSVEINSYADDGNIAFGTDSPLSSFSFGPGAFSASGSEGIPGGLSAPYSLTLEAIIDHTSAGQSTSFNAEMTAPEPSTAILLGGAVLGFALLRRRRKAA